MIKQDCFLVSIVSNKGGTSFMSCIVMVEHKYYDDIEFLEEINKKVKKLLSQSEEAFSHSDYAIVSITNITKIKPVKEN